MFELARRFIKTSLIFAVLSVLLGMHMIATQRFGQTVKPLHWLPTAHGHLFLVGFVTMMIMGVAIWIFPRPKGSRYLPVLSEATYWLITLGTIVRGIGEVGASYFQARWLLPLSAIGGIAQGLAILLFILNIWTRIQPIGKLVQEDREPTQKQR